MTRWGGYPYQDPPSTPTAPPGYYAPARREGLEPVYVAAPDARALRISRLRRRLDQVIKGPPVVHNTPRGGIFSHAPGDECEFCDALLDADP